MKLAAKDFAAHLGALAAGLLLVGVVHASVVSPKREEAMQAATALTSSRADLAAADAKRVELAALIATGERERLELAHARARRSIPSSNEAMELAARVSEICHEQQATGLGIDIGAATPMDALPAAAGERPVRCQRVPIDVRLTTDWERLGAILDELRALPWLVVVEEVTFTRADVPAVRVELRLATFFYEPDGPPVRPEGR